MFLRTEAESKGDGTGVPSPTAPFPDNSVTQVSQPVIWRLNPVFSTIGTGEKNFRPDGKISSLTSELNSKEPAMMTNCVPSDSFEISPRFRRTVEDRIARLERDAQLDEAHAALLVDGDHIRRHMQLVAVERAEALRMRLFLDRATVRTPRPLVEL
jgi:hypothetical protein